MLNKIKAAWAVLQRGQELSNVETWKVKQNAINALAGLVSALVVLARAFGYDLPVSDEDALLIAGGVAVVIGLFVNPYITTATTKRIGLPPKPVGDAQVPGQGHDLGI